MGKLRTSVSCAVALLVGACAACDAMAQAWQSPETACGRSSTIFCSGFEEGNKSIWDDYDGNPDSTNLLMSHPGPLNHSGNHVMRLRVPAGEGNSDLVKVLPNQHDRLYARWYQLWETGFDFNAGNHGSGLHGGDRSLLGRSHFRPDGTDRFSAWIEPLTRRLNVYTYYRGMYQDCVDPNGSCWGDHFPCFVDEGSSICEKPQHRETVMPPQLEHNRWYCLELMLDAGTPVQRDQDANGMMSMAIDGVSYGTWNDLWFRTTPNLKISILWLNLYHHGQHSVPGVMFDNVVVATEPIGCLGAAPDTLAPAAPERLRQ